RVAGRGSAPVRARAVTMLGTAAAGRPAASCSRSTATLASRRPGVMADAEPRHVPVPCRRHGIAYALLRFPCECIASGVPNPPRRLAHPHPLRRKEPRRRDLTAPPAPPGGFRDA